MSLRVKDKCENIKLTLFMVNLDIYGMHIINKIRLLSNSRTSNACFKTLTYLLKQIEFYWRCYKTK